MKSNDEGLTELPEPVYQNRSFKESVDRMGEGETHQPK
jgi:hypothetical protein